jgi:hypothetical protein
MMRVATGEIARNGYLLSAMSSTLSLKTLLACTLRAIVLDLDVRLHRMRAEKSG